MLPNLLYLSVQDTLIIQQDIPASYVLAAAAYAACYTVALLLLGMALFQTREMDVREGSSAAPGVVNRLAWALRIAAVAAGGWALIALGGLFGASGPAAVSGRAAAIAWAGGAFIGAALLWEFAGCLGRGARWAFLVLLIVATAQLIVSMAYLLLIRPSPLSGDQRIGLLIVSAALAGYVLYMSIQRDARLFRLAPGLGGLSSLSQEAATASTRGAGRSSRPTSGVEGNSSPNRTSRALLKITNVAATMCSTAADDRRDLSPAPPAS